MWQERPREPKISSEEQKVVSFAQYKHSPPDFLVKYFSIKLVEGWINEKNYSVSLEEVWELFGIEAEELDNNQVFRLIQSHSTGQKTLFEELKQEVREASDYLNESINYKKGSRESLIYLSSCLSNWYSADLPIEGYYSVASRLLASSEKVRTVLLANFRKLIYPALKKASTQANLKFLQQLVGYLNKFTDKCQQKISSSQQQQEALKQTYQRNIEQEYSVAKRALTLLYQEIIKTDIYKIAVNIFSQFIIKEIVKYIANVKRSQNFLLLLKQELQGEINQDKEDKSLSYSYAVQLGENLNSAALKQKISQRLGRHLLAWGIDTNITSSKVKEIMGEVLYPLVSTG